MVLCQAKGNDDGDFMPFYYYYFIRVCYYDLLCYMLYLYAFHHAVSVEYKCIDNALLFMIYSPILLLSAISSRFSADSIS